jgi:tRNA (guanine26-N2/guanine27-N2)-dimethyltransferase
MFKIFQLTKFKNNKNINNNKQIKNKIYEENIFINKYQGKISKKLKVFYNPLMKLNRDISLLVIQSYFEKPIHLCDPMAASGIRELRFLKTIPQKFNTITTGDISKQAIKNIKNNFKQNKISTKKLNIIHDNAINTINKNYYDFIEIDPFGSPVPFLDIACQKIKHNGILSVTATDTAALCGTYPKTTLRKYNIKIKKTLFFEELGLRNLIAYCQIQASKYNKAITPILSYSSDHYYKIFFQVEESKTKSLENIKKLKYINWNKKTQETIIEEFENKNSLGKTYIGILNDKNFLEKIKTQTNLIKDNKKIIKLIDSLYNEINIVGYYNPHKFQKEYKFSTNIKFETIINKLKEQKYQVSKPHNNRLGIKTNCPYKKFIKILKNNSNNK